MTVTAVAGENILRNLLVKGKKKKRKEKERKIMRLLYDLTVLEKVQ